MSRSESKDGGNPGRGPSGSPLSNAARWLAGLDVAVNWLLGNYIGLKPRKPKELVVPRFFVLERCCKTYAEYLTRHLHLPTLKHPAVISDDTTWGIAGQRLHDELRDLGLGPVDLRVQTPTQTEVRRVVTALSRTPRLWVEGTSRLDQRLCAVKKSSVIFAVGGGAVIDVGKLAARQLHLPCISVPTSLAHDGIASPFAVIDPEDLLPGMARVTTRTNTPLGVIIDLSNFLSSASGEFVKSMARGGIGDVISNATALVDWELAAREGKDQVDFSAVMYSRLAATAVLYRIASHPGIDDDESLWVLAAALLASGEAMSRLGSSRPASGFEHKLYHAFNNLLRLPSRAPHGVLVAVGTLISARAHQRLEDDVRSAFARVGLPHDKDSLEAYEIDPDDVVRAIHASVEIKPERYTILEHVGPEVLVDCFREAFDL